MQHPPLFPFPVPSPENSRRNCVIAFTTPQNYAPRLSELIHLKGWTPLWCPTVIVESTEQTISSIHHYLNPQAGIDEPNSFLEEFSALAFTSRTGITAFSQALSMNPTPPLTPNGEILTIAALGNDAELLDRDFIRKMCENPERIRVLVPSIATPSGLVEALGLGQGRKVLCPVPLVIGLNEPPVVPKFLDDLSKRGWIPLRLDAYETRWAGAKCAVDVVAKSEEECGFDAIVFTSTGEVEGLLKSLEEFGLDWSMVRRRCPRMVVAAHGPVTAAGAESLGVGIDVVSSNFGSFDGVVDALAHKWKSLQNQES
ncbi:hypothetical protein EJD97_017305 [Solanum chilense]|uniref:Tetrapyrrole biosynthesis uroporphyrinogen III synthase domain-containing protein n=1 Tax=Solanum chilense TaxID=4083 RepID=A0A6N2BB43_SOLCI|nr:hypothetical protein EJD97_017305 [Solanum chilense]